MATANRSVNVVTLKRFGLTHLLVQLDAVHNLQSQREITEQAVYTQETDEAEVSKHAVQWARAIFSNDLAIDMWCQKGMCNYS
jgi:hypothetical protein